MVLSDIELEVDSWRILIRSSQKHYPAKIRKGLLEKQIYGIRLEIFRIDPDKMMKKYNTRFLPILGKQDPLALKLVRDHHVENSFLDKVHLSIRTSLKNLSRGRFRIFFPEGRTYLHQMVNTSPRCLEQSEWCYKQELGKIYVKLDEFDHAF